jgi:hypothetical protein
MVQSGRNPYGPGCRDPSPLAGFSDDFLRRVREAKPKGLWGVDLCQVASQRPATILKLGGRTGDLRSQRGRSWAGSKTRESRRKLFTRGED